MRQFEYKETVVSVKWELESPDKWKEEGILQTKLNEHGRQGWQLVYIKEMIKHDNKR